MKTHYTTYFVIRDEIFISGHGLKAFFGIMSLQTTGVSLTSDLTASTQL